MPKELEREACQKFVMDAFLRGFRDRDRASGKEPKSLEDAFKWVQEASQLRKMVLGRRDGSKTVQSMYTYFEQCLLEDPRTQNQRWGVMRSIAGVSL